MTQANNNDSVNQSCRPDSRGYFSKKLNPAHIHPELLINKFIPIFTAEPFQISEAYAERAKKPQIAGNERAMKQAQTKQPGSTQ
jgi:hypothetical protein